MDGFEPAAEWQAAGWNPMDGQAGVGQPAGWGTPARQSAPWHAAYLAAGSSSFSDFLAAAAPGLLPRGQVGPAGMPGPGGAGGAGEIPHGTTIVTAVCDGGVVMAGDRRATAGSMIAQRDMEKVFPSDEFSCVGISGAAGVAVDMVRLFQVELEHYEKLEGRSLSLEGKANRLAGLVRSNLPAAMQGLVAVPLLAGFDEETDQGRIFSYDPTGGRYEEQRFASIGSGSIFARGSLKKLYRAGMSLDDVVLALMQALYDAADDDSATGGPDVSRKIYPSVATVTADGYRRLSEQEASQYAQTVVEQRQQQPDGPGAALRQAAS
ncbi:MAG TPA: proteasome subunit beta [Streptosporangiaceae bacterium]